VKEIHEKKEFFVWIAEAEELEKPNLCSMFGARWVHVIKFPEEVSAHGRNPHFSKKISPNGGCQQSPFP